MTNITLKQIDESNFLDCFQLELRESQKEFVSHPIRSLAQAYVYDSQCTPYGIYHDNKMVGYVMVIYDYDESTYNIWHLMIDKTQQGKGYGRLAMQRVLDVIRSKPFGGSNTVLLTCNPDNKAAYNLYQSLGFTETGRKDEEEVEMSYVLR